MNRECSEIPLAVVDGRPAHGGLLQTLLELGASPDYKDSRGLTALYHTAIVGGDPYCCELLLHERASVSCQDENGWHEIHQVSSARPRPFHRDSL